MTDTVRVLGGRYEVGRLIGRGGMAEVHLGHDTRLGRQVAIKMLRADLARDSTFLARFRREAQAAAGLNHHAIVAVYDSGEDAYTEVGGATVDVPYIVMEYVDGKTLREILNEEGRLAPDEAARVTMGILSALEYSHDKGIVHRDIKPANVMVTKGGSVKVMDFGIARALADAGATMTSAQAVVGTARYLSPEQAQGGTLDARSDLYSAGCVLFELLAGRTPFVGEPVSLVYQHVSDQPKPPSAYEPSVPTPMDAVALHALEKQAAHRYQSAAAFRADLQSARSGRALSAGAMASLAAHGRTAEPVAGEAQAPVASPVRGDDTRELTDERQARHTGLWLAAALAALLAILGIGYLVTNGPGNARHAAVPDVRGQDQAAADEAIRNADFVPEDRSVASDQDKGTVVRTDPGGGASRPVGSTIAVYVSAGPGNVVIPDVSGMSPAAARDALAKVGIGKVDVAGTRVDNTRFPANQVATTTPGIGSTLDPATRLTLNISSGQVQVPTGLVGSESGRAQNKLENAYLKPQVQIVTTTNRSEVGRVMSVEPEEGRRLSVGSDVVLRVGTLAAATVTSMISPPAPAPPPAPLPTSSATVPAPEPTPSASSSAPPSSSSGRPPSSGTRSTSSSGTTESSTSDASSSPAPARRTSTRAGRTGTSPPPAA